MGSGEWAVIVKSDQLATEVLAVIEPDDGQLSMTQLRSDLQRRDFGTYHKCSICTMSCVSSEMSKGLIPTNTNKSVRIIINTVILSP